MFPIMTFTNIKTLNPLYPFSPWAHFVALTPAKQFNPSETTRVKELRCFLPHVVTSSFLEQVMCLYRISMGHLFLDMAINAIKVVLAEASCPRAPFRFLPPTGTSHRLGLAFSTDGCNHTRLLYVGVYPLPVECSWQRIRAYYHDSIWR